MKKTVSLSFFWRTLFLGFALLLNVTLGYRLFFSEQSFFAWQGVQRHFSNMQQQLLDIQQKLTFLSEEIRLLQSNNDYIERAVRERLNYVRENEILYVFEKKQLVNSIWTETEEDLQNE
jgi:cell division protein FtsB